MKRLMAIMNKEADPGVPMSREDRRLLEKGLTSSAMLLAQQSSFDLNASMGVDEEAGARGASFDDQDANAENAVFPSFARIPSFVDGDPMLETHDLSDIPSGERKEGQVSEMMAYWNSNAIVGSLHRPVRIVDGRGALPMLGPRSYFEESFAETVRENARLDELKQAREIARKEELRLNPKLAAEQREKELLASKTASSLSVLAGKGTGSVYYVPEGKEEFHAMKPEDMKRTIAERKELFYKLIRKKKPGDEASDTEPA